MKYALLSYGRDVFVTFKGKMVRMYQKMIGIREFECTQICEMDGEMR